MKKKKMLLIILICVFMMILLSCKQKKNYDAESINEFSKQCTENYVVLRENDNGGVEIKIEAPDIEAIAGIMNDSQVDITIENLIKTINENSEYIKEYIFEVDELNDDKIKAQFLDNIAKELMIAAIESSNNTEEWSEE